MRSLVNFRHTGIKLGASQSLQGTMSDLKSHRQLTQKNQLCFFYITLTLTFKRVFTNSHH